ncbi:MAG TPA: ABC transporter substrate-binding protein [Candidatus Bathyarchaeia archaeon]|nr:ABC transporter substrate-binding protein [Candidatus Bathyarchaeia archaeon]
MINRFVLIFSALILIIGGWFMFTRYHKTENAPSEALLRVGIVGGYAPWSFLDKDGQYKGFDVDVANAIAQRVNKKTEFFDLSPEALWLALETGKIDIIVSPLAITQKRQEKYHMIHYQGGGVKHYPLIFWNAIPKDVKSIEDFEKRPEHAVICVNPGTRQEDFLRQYPFLDIMPIGAIVDIIMNLKFGKAAAAMVDPDIVVNIKEQNPEIQVLQVPIGPEHQSEGNGIAIKKENNELADRVRDIISTLKADGFISANEQKWNIRRLEDQ